MMHSMFGSSNRIKRPTFLVHTTITEVLVQVLEFLLIFVGAMNWVIFTGAMNWALFTGAMNWAPTFTRNELRFAAIGGNLIARVLWMDSDPKGIAMDCTPQSCQAEIAQAIYADIVRNFLDTATSG